MAMNFDTYSTSFQSLMKPMYNVNANYMMGAGGFGRAGAGIYGGYMNPAMMGMSAMGPMANIGVGQFNANYLLQGEDQMNNYYARPVAAHKKENDTGTILGILGTALGTAALIAAMAKGKFRRVPGNGRAPITPPPAGGGTTNPPIRPTGSSTVVPSSAAPQAKTAPAPAVTAPAPAQTAAPAPVVTASAPTGTTPAPTGTTPAPVKPNLPPLADLLKAQGPSIVLPAASNAATATAPAATQIAGYLPAPAVSQRMQNALNKQAAAMNLPSSGNVITTPLAPGQAPAAAQVAGYLPAPAVSQRMQNALNKQAAAMNLPSSGNVITTPLTPQQATAAGIRTPEAQAAYDRVLAQQFKPGLKREAARADARAAFRTPADMANQKLNEVRPDLGSQGAVVHTTHTPETISAGYSIGSNAKGADQLAALLAQMKA